MKKLLITLLAVGCAATALADIQAPPNSHHTRVHKLGRGISNVLYGAQELPSRVMHVNRHEGNNAAFGSGVVEGVKRSLCRIGWGIIEVASFPVKTHRNSFKAPYQNIEYDPYNGYSEFVPELGFQSKYNYARSQQF